MHLDITSDDYHLGVELDDRVRRHLIRHFTAFLKAKIAERGFTPDDPLLFDQDQIEDKAWWLTDRVIQEVQERVADELADAALAERLTSSTRLSAFGNTSLSRSPRKSASIWRTHWAGWMC